jgi:type IV pilus assembly protein PilO
VQLELVGSYHDVVLFFQAVGNLSRIVNISNLTIGKPKTDDGQTTLSVNCLATTFRFLEGS